MEIKLEELKCGECGNEKHKLYLRPNGEIITECCKCKCQSEIIVTKPEIKIRNNFGSGTLCVF